MLFAPMLESLQEVGAVGTNIYLGKTFTWRLERLDNERAYMYKRVTGIDSHAFPFYISLLF